LTEDIRSHLASALGDNYRLERELGGGGMSRVFVAEDTVLARKVVVKVLSPDLAGTVNLERFRREILLAARLQHPHIVPVLSAGVAGDLPFFTMPLVRGESLRARLSRLGELPLAETVTILRDVAKALCYAHREGVVHRDIKPENVLVDDGTAVVTDFGVAKALSSATEAEKGTTGTLTSIGVALGTPGYMAPEQAAADPHVDHRADIYSFGAMAYEMIAGHPPFAGRSPQQTLAAHSMEAPVPVERHRRAAPPQLAQLVMRCLEKRPGDRPQSTDEVLHELNTLSTPVTGTAPRAATAAVSGESPVRRWTVAAAAAILVVAAGFWIRQALAAPKLNPRRVAVAPFENNTGDPALDVVGRIASDWITHGISQLDSIDVVSSPAAIEASSGEGDMVKSLGERAKAGTVVWGTYHRQGDSLRFQVQVTDANTRRVIRSLEPVSGLASDPLPAITQLRERLLSAVAMTGSRPVFASTVQPPRYDAYREASMGMARYVNERNFAASIPHFERAIELDSGFLVPYGFLFFAYRHVGRPDKSESIAQAAQRLRATARSDDIDMIDYLAAHLQRDEPSQIRIARRWAARDSTMLQLYLVAWHARRLNRPREAIAALQRVDEESRRSGWFPYWLVLAEAHHLTGDHEQELEAARRGRSHYGENVPLAEAELRALAALGRVAQVRALLDSLMAAHADTSYRAIITAKRVAANELRAHGYREEAQRLYQETVAWFEDAARAGRLPRNLLQPFGLTLFDVGRLDSANAVLTAALAADTANVFLRGVLGVIAAKRGDTASARAAVAGLEPVVVAPSRAARARIHAALGEKPEAMRALHAAIEAGDGFGPWAHTIREFEALRDYPPYREFLRPKG
jgi:eukaryotic-like serine/threonine-protein kinase